MKLNALAVTGIVSGLILAGSTWAISQDQEVILGGRLAQRIRVSAGGLSPQERVNLIELRIAKHLATTPLEGNQIHLQLQGSDPAIYMGPYLITTVTQGDADATRMTKIALAQQWLEGYREALPLAKPMPR